AISSQNQHLKPSLLVRWMLSAHLRQILWGPEFNRDVLLNLDGSFVQESGLVTHRRRALVVAGRRQVEPLTNLISCTCPSCPMVTRTFMVSADPYRSPVLG